MDSLQNIQKMKNYGLNLELEKKHQSPDDWIFGAESKSCIAQIPQQEREKYLPIGEVQRGSEDTMDCASRAPINILETKFTWLVKNGILSQENINWLTDNAYIEQDRTITFSDCFVAQNSGTTREGNSMIAPLDAIRKQGLIPKHMLPLEPWMRWSDYHDPKRITDAMRKLGLDFAMRFLINYERVLSQDFEKVYEHDMIDMAGFAWPTPINGEYPTNDNPANHVFMGIFVPKHFIFDNYIDIVDGDFIKKLAPDYNLLEFGYRLFITEQKTIALPVKKSLFSNFCKFLKVP